MPTAISIRNVTKTFPQLPGGTKTPAVDNISLDIQPGELFFLLGPSGCGKTTLLRMIAGFIETTGGSIFFDNRDITHLPPNKRNTGMVFQSYALWPHLTVAQNVAFGLDVRGVHSAEQAKRIDEALKLVRMDPYKERKPNQLSGGQQQRVALARSLVVRPDVLLLDEPLSNLDAKLRIELRQEIRRICKESAITTVYVTHDQKEALSMADRLAILRSGRLIEVGEPEALYRLPTTSFVADFLGETNLLRCVVRSSDASSAVVGVASGQLQATSRRPLPPSAPVVISVRPEAWKIGEGVAGLPGRVRSRVFLGEVAQYMIELADGQSCSVAEFSPATERRVFDTGEAVTLTTKPAGAVIVDLD